MAALLLCSSVLTAPLLFPKSSTSAETRVAFTRVDAVRQLSSTRADSAEVPQLVLAEFLSTTTTLAPAKPKAHRTTTTTTVRRGSYASAKPKPKPAAASTAAKSRTTTTTRAAAKPAPSAGPASTTGHSETGKASWYDAPAGTCAHRSLPKGLVVTVTNVANSKSITCRVSDRGPYVDGRIIDLSRSGFQALGSAASGVITVRVDW